MIQKKSSGLALTEADVLQAATAFVEQEQLRGKRVLALIPDHTRTAPVDVMFRTLYGLLGQRPGSFDVLIALGTHPPMSEQAIDKRLGLAPGERKTKYPNTTVYNHFWRDPAALRTAGILSGSQMNSLSGGRFTKDVTITVNKLVYNYDVVLIVGPTFPHEVVGFSGGNKYIFPGISGQEIIDTFHWLGALITSPVVIGRKHTPVRAVVDAAARLLPMKRLCMSLVVTSEGLQGLYCGTPEETWSAAADLSATVHIVTKQKAYTSVLSCPAPMYDELWVAAKAAYKLEPVVADGGELIIYAPNLREISTTHGTLIRSIGYHVKDYFVSRMDQFANIPGGVLAHSTHVKGAGNYENGKETPRINVILATGIPKETCEEINLGYRDPTTIDPEMWKNKESKGKLYVPKSGETLYRLLNDPFPPPTQS